MNYYGWGYYPPDIIATGWTPLVSPLIWLLTLAAVARSYAGRFYAKTRSAIDPCLSPYESFLKAYETSIGFPSRYYPFILAIATSELSKLS